MAAKMGLTKEQYNSLNPMATELHDYWMKFKPKMYKEMVESGVLWDLVQREGNRLNDMVIELTPKIGLAGAKEVARAEIYDETDEPMEEDPDEMTEQDKRNQELWELHCEMMHLLNDTRDDLRRERLERTDE